MLVKFNISNYKSYHQDTKFTMVKAPRIRDLSYSLLREKIKSNNFEVLCSSVLYGPNASGKSNLVDAMNTLKNIVLRGNLKNNQSSNIFSSQTNLELIPFIFSESHPVNFNIEFITKGNHYNYYLSISIGEFLNDNPKREVLSEKLSINFITVFERTKNKIDFQPITNELKDDFIDDINSIKITQMFNETLVEDSLFLTNGFKNLSKKYSQDIINWFENDLIVIDNMHRTFAYPILQNKEIYVDKFVNEIAKISGMTGSEIAYIKDNNSTTVPASLIKKNKNNSKDIFIPVKYIESYGTGRIIQIMPLILKVLQDGSTLVFDELDVALHPKVMMNIIKIFHNDEININKAQLIFNTHNPIYLNNAIFRRDEIKFVEKDFDTHESIIYSLSDFGTKGTNSVRNTTDYIKNYFMNKYGAIIDIDYSDVFLHMMRGNKDDKTK